MKDLRWQFRCSSDLDILVTSFSAKILIEFNSNQPKLTNQANPLKRRKE